ncbi:transient receptor potential cation channel subfamily A member 1-like isoform X2 [Xenia sp. Carnegie-2017]|uniref:transient receptor potential cation channel subfamily A member 1-like isoform X2 n=1 Tax=Xenia sp. Carnegie-2017 TaxID=2897299 RepID=UPI001F044171|nr:transient receptor potential cation channel subfamily A member 1-like isoform X2 [Xenia sp. Carnegie-2017]
MSKNEREVLSESFEHDDESDYKENNGKSRKQKAWVTASLRSHNGRIKSFIRKVQRGSSVRFVCIEEEELQDMDITETDDFQRNILHHAVSKPNTLKEILKVFKDDARISEALREADKVGELPIHRAAVLGNTESLEMLYGHDTTLMLLRTTKGNESVLHSAVKSRSLLVVKYILTCILKEDPKLVNAVDNLFQSPVHYAAAFKQSNVLELLLSYGCDSTLIDTNDQIPLHIACSKGFLKNVQLLVQEHPDTIDLIDHSAQTPLILAAKYGFPKIVSYLLASKADFSLKDKIDFTAFDWALQRNLPAIVESFQNTANWKEILKESKNGPENSLCVMIAGMPEMAKLLLDKCIETKENRGNGCMVTYDFFCLESKDNNGAWPKFAALEMMTKQACEICLQHPVSKKYVNVKWKRRGFKYFVSLLIFDLVFHILFLVYTTEIIGGFHSYKHINRTGGKNTTMTENKRRSQPLNASAMIFLRVIMLIITFASLTKELVQIFVERFNYFKDFYHWLRLVLILCVIFYILPLRQELTTSEIGFGAIICLFSWTNFMQVLKLTPIFGLYLNLIEKVVWTLMKIFAVVVVYILTYSTTFYILLAEDHSFGNMYISFFSTFVAMMNGFENNDLFLKKGMYPQLFHIKLFVLLLFLLIMSIVVQNVLIGLAVGDTHEVMKLATFGKLKRRLQGRSVSR